MKPAFHVAAFALLLAAATTHAQDLTFYEFPDFGGGSYDAYDAIADLANTGYNDRANSVVIRNGMWQLCTDANYRGRCVTLQPGEYREPGIDRIVGQDLVGAARRLRPHGRRPGRQRAPPAARPSSCSTISSRRATSSRSTVPSTTSSARTFNDRARSMIINAGRWELCRDAFFHGTCEVYGPGRYDAIGDLSGEVSSLRPVGGALAQPGRYPADWGRQVRAILYSNPDFQGQQHVINDDVMRNLANTGFNDRAQSIRVEQGFWIFCSDADFGGTCRTFGPGDYPTLPWGLNNAVSSGRRISRENPYSGSPNWGR